MHKGIVHYFGIESDIVNGWHFDAVYALGRRSRYAGQLRCRK